MSPQKKFCSKNLCDFLYNKDESIIFTTQEKIDMSSSYFFQN